MKKNLFYYIKISLLLFAFTVNGQESINASGHNATGTGGSASYSLGQVVYTTYSGTNGSVAQGVQQPYEISVILGIEYTNINLIMTVSPNPTKDLLTLKVDNYEFENLTYQLLDINGKQFLLSQTSAAETQISVASLPSAIYFLKVSDKNKVIKTFKISKK